MKIKSIKISNILSFEFNSDIDKCQEIQFDENLNVLIGPNGSGKSNFLEIINQIFRNALFLDCIYNENQIKSYQQNPSGAPLNGTLQPRQRTYNLTKNNYSNNDSKEVKITIELNSNDIENLIFVQKNATKINELFVKYSNQSPNFSTTITENDLRTYKNTLTLHFQDLENKKSLTNVTTLPDETFRFIFQYLRYFDFLQSLIIIANKEESQNWALLKNTFALMGSYRNYNRIDPTFVIEPNESNKFQSIKDRILQDSTILAVHDEPVVFAYVKHKLAYTYNQIREDLLEKKLANPDKKHPIEFLQNHPIMKNINELLDSALGLRLHVERPEANSLSYVFSFLDNNRKTIQIVELSSGEKSIIHFIFSLYGYDLEKGVVIIDEPELHLHPQIQQKFLTIIEKVMGQLDLQFIIATHSPVFVNSKTIEGVQRFYKIDDKFTKVVRPTITSSEKELVQVLTYTNSAKIFFTNKVVLVEGDSDEYFFRFFFDQYKKDKMKTDVDIEFLYIGGKGRFRFWKDFLTKYEIKTYYIGDLDNILDVSLSIVDEAKINTFREDFESQPDIIQRMKDIPGYERSSKCYNKDLLKYVKTKPEWNGIKSKIEGRYADKMYILKEGELENYLNSHGKLEGVIDFCKNKFGAWCTDAANKTKTDELNKIFDLIVA